MDLSEDGLHLAELISAHIAKIDGVDPSLNEFLASLFEAVVPGETGGADEAALADATRQMVDMLSSSVPVPEAAEALIQAAATACAATWRDLLTARRRDGEGEGAARGGSGGGGEQGGGAGAPPVPEPRLLVAVSRNQQDDVFAPVSADVKAATMARFYAQADDGEEESWFTETAPSTFNGQTGVPGVGGAKGGGGKPGASTPLTGGGGKEPPKTDFSSRVAALDSFMCDVAGSDSMGAPRGPTPGGRRARKHARAQAGGRGGAQSSSEDDAPPPPSLPPSRIVEFDPMDIRLDNREYSAFLDRQRRMAAKGEAEADKAREREKAEAVRAARELQRNAKVVGRSPG